MTETEIINSLKSLVEQTTFKGSEYAAIGEILAWLNNKIPLEGVKTSGRIIEEATSQGNL